MLAPIEQLKKETIAFAAKIEQFFVNGQLTKEKYLIKEEDLYKIHKNAFKVLMSKRILGPSQIRFLTSVIRSSTALYRIYTHIERSYSSQYISKVFSTELCDIKNDLNLKLKKCIDAFSYDHDELILPIYNKRARDQQKLLHVEKSIFHEIENDPKLLKEGYAALKQLFLYKNIDEEVNEMINHVLYTLGHIQHSGEEKVEKVNMLDYILSKEFSSEVRSPL